ncbi:type II secretion system protein GspL [Paraburkholderia caribensis]|uniref:Type II secretion system protein GspL n=1 Tax=Paraburkholderia caribensis TaxID=75105 RepID=A0A9Q6S0V6_9BURK|nr:type II secretion system protein GspL [Paraburkholderia caribensis]ALP61511.1 type II secretion system protein GspL [Paraburkholderia caribensis]AUT53267.1 type II secretion system protein GspL [Paraburkholderia caribensis]MCO4875864.1 type II secretion system protein GspL [Paraburkholderia caribensis]PTB29625.1 type II secretion system protein GspL [Paraburkholderia caribensis]QLB62511.1 type II secretion system protein GspL [Paraburkholderia caribensis]
MSTLIVLLPPRDPAVPSQEWQLPELPFLLLDKSGRVQRAGRSAPGLLPRASATVLMLAARDCLMLATAVPPLKGPRLRQALPNVVEDQLIQDPQTTHIALDPQPLDGNRHVLAIVDRGWFRYIVETFAAAGHRNVKVVPVTRCLPQPVAAMAADVPVEEAVAAGADAPPPRAEPVVAGLTPVVAAVLGHVVPSTAAVLGEGAVDAAPPRVELALARGPLGEGLAVPESAVGATVAALAGDAPVTLYTLVDLPGSEPRLASVAQTGRPSIAGSLPVSFETLARNAIQCRFDLAQFEFAVQPWRLDRASLRRLRLPLWLLVGTVLVAIIGANVQWLMLSRQRDAISAQMTELLLNTFPKTTVVLDAPDQMARQLQQLRVAAGELSPDDFLSLADGLARSLGPIPVNGLAALDYHDRRVDVTFKPEIKVDPDFQQRLTRNGLTGAIDSNTGKWTIRNGQ